MTVWREREEDDSEVQGDKEARPAIGLVNLLLPSPLVAGDTSFDDR